MASQEHDSRKSFVDAQRYPACTNSINLGEELLSIFDRLRTAEENLKQREEEVERITREKEALVMELRDSKAESLHLKRIAWDHQRESRRLFEDNRNLSFQLNALKGRPFEDGKDISKDAQVEQAPVIPHTVQSGAVYRGHHRRLVMALDVGTTFSCVSYSLLDPGQVPVIKGVTRYPSQEMVIGGSKIPSVLYYDRQGKVRAVGAEAQREDIYERAEDEMWTKCEWFKLHLCSNSIEIPPLPLNKSVVEVFADYLKYLFDCASRYIQDTHANGPNLWLAVKDDTAFILPHPNGWEATQQTQMIKAAILAGIIPDTPAGRARVSFVTEGEASLHFAMQNGLPAEAMQEGDGVAIVDAGGGTIDFSTFSRCAGSGNNTFEEIAAPQCHFQGSVFVTIHAQRFLNEYLANSKFIDDLDHIVRCFDKSTKVRFRDAAEKQYIKFGSTRDSDVSYGIRFGQLLIQGSNVAKFFEPSINCIINAILDVQKSTPRKISHVVLVGGFSASDWLFNQVVNSPLLRDLHVVRPDSHVNKAVSDGAISFYIDRFVRTRISRATYGMFCHIPYDPTKTDHLERASNAFTSISGSKRIGDAFDIILPIKTQVLEDKEFRQSYFRESRTRYDFKDVSVSIWCYKGPSSEPSMWKDLNNDKYHKIWTIKLDLSHINSLPRSKSDGEQGNYYRIDYDLVFIFGWTNLKVQLAWKENGTEKRTNPYDRSDTTIISEES